MAYSSNRKRVLLQALSMTIIPFVPASNLFFPVGFVVAERILYIPSMGVCILVVLGISVMFTKNSSNLKVSRIGIKLQPISEVHLRKVQI